MLKSLPNKIITNDIIFTYTFLNINNHASIIQQTLDYNTCNNLRICAYAHMVLRIQYNTLKYDVFLTNSYVLTLTKR